MTRKKRKHTVAMVIGCAHMPYVLKPAWNLTVQAIEIIKPDILLLNGDGADFAGICPMNKDVRVEVNFEKDELIPVRACVDELESAVSRQCDLIWQEGNHEHWWSKYYLDKPAVRAKTWFEELKLTNKWEIREYDDEEMPEITFGDLTVAHGTKVRQHSGWTARAELNDRWVPIMIAHTHRMGSYFFTPADTGVIYDAYEIGCLADQTTARKYMKKKPNWQHGFAVVSFDKKSGWFEVALKKISRIRNTPTYRLGLHEGVLECKM